MSDTPSRTDNAGGALQVKLVGDPAPFDVTDDASLAPLRVGALGPAVRFDAPVKVSESVVPRQVTVPPLRFSDPGLKAVKVEDMLYAGRVAGSSLEATVFGFEAEDGPRTAIFLFDRDLVITAANTSAEWAPGGGRATVGPPEGHADAVYCGPLDRQVAVVLLKADGRPVAAVRPRARFAVFDALELKIPKESRLRFLAYGSSGTVIHKMSIPPLLGDDRI